MVIVEVTEVGAVAMEEIVVDVVGELEIVEGHVNVVGAVEEIEIVGLREIEVVTKEA